MINLSILLDALLLIRLVFQVLVDCVVVEGAQGWKYVHRLIHLGVLADVAWLRSMQI